GVSGAFAPASNQVELTPAFRISLAVCRLCDVVAEPAPKSDACWSHWVSRRADRSASPPFGRLGSAVVERDGCCQYFPLYSILLNSMSRLGGSPFAVDEDRKCHIACRWSPSMAAPMTLRRPARWSTSPPGQSPSASRWRLPRSAPMHSVPASPALPAGTMSA